MTKIKGGVAAPTPKRPGRPRLDRPPESSASWHVNHVSFQTNDVPRNLSNAGLPKVSWSAESESSEARKWREWSKTWGAIGRRNAGWQMADPTTRARVTITFYRVRSMDKDGRFKAAVPILNGLKVVVGHRKAFGHMVPIEGCGLIYDDDPTHVADDDYQVRWEPVAHFADQRTVVEVKRLESRS